MDSKRLLIIALISTLVAGTAAFAGDKADNTWFTLLYADGNSGSLALASPLERNLLEARFNPPAISAAQPFGAAPRGSAELMGSLVAFGLLYRVLRRRRAL